MSVAVVGAGKRKKPWPRVHLVYFLLAAFDLLAIAGGLYLSHRVIQVFESNVTSNAALDDRLMASWTVIDTASEANTAVIGAFETAGTRQAADRFHAKLYEVRTELKSFRGYVGDAFPEGAARRALSIIGKIELLISSIESDAAKVFALLDAGESKAAVEALGLMQRRYTSLRFHVNDFNRLVAMVKVGKTEQDGRVVAGLRKYEHWIAGMIVLMVCGVAFYGHWLGRLMRRKYEELHAAQEETDAFASELSTVNQEITALNVELAGNVQKLKDAQDEIVKRGKMAQLGQLTATVAHELRNPLSAVRTSVFLLDRKTRGNGLEIEPIVQRINNGIARCDGIITQLLDFARAQALQCEAVVFDDWLAKLVREEGEKLPAAVSVVCELGAGEHEAPMDAARMARVFINLIANASDAMVGKGDDPAKFTTSDPRITIVSRVTRRGMEVSVSDNGPGIPADVMPKILEPLFTTKSFGTGLGLPAAEKVLQLHGGGLEIESEPGKGARFTAWFPLAEACDKAA
ncbi:MAG: sensor histidine kinase [Parvibaculaceae bacterium]